MNRKTSTFLSIGISAVLVAGAIWFLFNYHNDMWATGPWTMPHGMMMGGGMGFLMMLFWVVVLDCPGTADIGGFFRPPSVIPYRERPGNFAETLRAG